MQTPDILLVTGVLGLWGFLYVTIIPGLLAVRLLRLHRVFAGLPLAFALSLIISHATVCVLTIAGLYTRPVMLILAVGGTIALFLVAAPWPETGFARLIDLVPRVFRYMRAAFAERRSLPRMAPLVSSVVTVISFYELVSYGSAAVQNFGDVFTVWDSVVSWNLWARSWAAGVVPDATYYYPQLLPTTWSVPYVLMERTDLQLFSASIDRFYLVFMIWALFEYSLRRQRLWLLAAIPAAIVLLATWNSPYMMSESLADVPVAFFALFAVMLVILMRQLSDRADIVMALWLVAAMAFGAASTKQAGIVIALAAPFLVWFYGIPRREALSRADMRSIARAFVLSTVVMLVLSAAWYVHSQLMILAGRNVSEIHHVTWGIYEGRSIPERVIAAVTMLARAPASTAIIPILLLAALSLRAGSWRIPLFAISAGFLALWAAFFSYDGRNATLALPILALLAGEGLVAWRLPFFRLSRQLAGHLSAHVPSSTLKTKGRWFPEALRTVGTLRMVAVLACILVGLIAVFEFPTERLQARERYFEETRIGDAELNARLEAAIERNGPHAAPIFTEYRWACLIDRIYQGHPCRLSHSSHDVADSIAVARGAMIVVIGRASAHALAPDLLKRGFTYIDAAGGYELWERVD